MIVVAALLACTGKPADTDVEPPVSVGGLLGDHPLNPFPVGALHTADGHLAMDPADFDLPDALTPLPFERLGWRTGFSVAQTSVVVLPEVDASALPGWRAPTPGEGGVRLADLTDAVWLPVMAELDAHPDADTLTLLIRPLQAVPVGHEVGVVVTTAVTPRPARFDALLAGDPPADLVDHAAELTSVVDAIEAMGTARADIALAWSFPVGDGTLPMRSAWSQVTTPTTWSFDSVRNVADGDLPPRTWRFAEGRYDVQDFLVGDTSLSLGADGSVSPTGTGQARLFVHVPESVSDAPAGSVPVLLFGHGLLGEPPGYLDDPDDVSRVIRVADEAGFIVVATDWRGLSLPDRLDAVAVAQDFGRMHELTDRLVQAQANVSALIKLIKEGGLLADPVFVGESGQALADPAHVRYYGISLGGIEGAVMLAADPPLDGAVLHVGGSTWSTMLERSSNWPAFEIFLDSAVDDPLARQRLFAVSQLWWDAADPISYTVDLSQRDFLLQESIGDEQVPNLTTRTLARSVGLPQAEPIVEAVWGLDPVALPLPPGSRAFMQFDPETDLPPDVNRPAPITRAHDEPRTWVGQNHQVIDYLTIGSEGQVVHWCGAGPCTASNQGE